MKSFLIGLFLVCASQVGAAITWTCTKNFQQPLSAGYLIAGTCVSDTGNAPTGTAGDALTWGAICGSATRVAKSVIFSTAISANGVISATANYNVSAQTLQLAVAPTPSGNTVYHTSLITTAPTAVLIANYIAVCQ